MHASTLDQIEGGHRGQQSDALTQRMADFKLTGGDSDMDYYEMRYQQRVKILEMFSLVLRFILECMLSEILVQCDRYCRALQDKCSNPGGFVFTAMFVALRVMALAYKRAMQGAFEMHS